jgi:hypothetical protein
MQIDLKTISFDGALRGLCELGDERLVVHVEQSLVVVSGQDLTRGQLPDRSLVLLGPSGKGMVVATKVAVDNAWTVDRSSQRVLLARAGEISLIDPTGKVDEQTIKVSNLPPGTFGVALDGDGQRALLVIVRDVNMDFAEYAVGIANLASGHLVLEAKIGSTNELEVLWDDKLRTWVIGNTNTGLLWRWDGEKPAVKLEGPGAGPVQSATFAASGERVVISALVAQDGGASLIEGRVERDRVVWSEPIALPGGPVLLARRHTERPLWACLAEESAGQQIQIRDATGAILAAAGVRPAALLHDLLWSLSSPDRLWGIGVRALAAATVLTS